MRLEHARARRGPDGPHRLTGRTVGRGPPGRHRRRVPACGRHARPVPGVAERRPDPPVHHLAQHPRLRPMATPHRRAGCSLQRHWLAARARARPEARTSSPERTAPANAGSRTIRTGTARPPGLPGTPRRSRVRTDHTSHSSPATFRSAAGPRCPARCPVLIARPFTSVVPARPQCGHRALPPGPELVRAAPVVVVPRRRSAQGRWWSCEGSPSGLTCGGDVRPAGESRRRRVAGRTADACAC
jgi:hypothetical protein